MSGNGAMIGMLIMLPKMLIIQSGQRKGNFGCFAAAPGLTLLLVCAVRTGATVFRATSTTAAASV